jgi:ABC-type multidrug transport system fused ATPase/permease subunit
MNLSMAFVSLSATSARSTFHPQRPQKGLLERAKNWRIGTGEPQRGQVTPLMVGILVDLSLREEDEFGGFYFADAFCRFRATRGFVVKNSATKLYDDEMDSLISIRSLMVELPTAAGWVRPVNGVSLQIGALECVGLVGGSGSGKTMLSLALMGLLPVGARISGEVLLGGGEEPCWAW